MSKRTGKTGPAAFLHSVSGSATGPVTAIALAAFLGVNGCANGPFGGKAQSSSSAPPAAGDPAGNNGANGAGAGTLAGASTTRPGEGTGAAGAGAALPSGAGIGLGSGWLVGARRDLIDHKKEQEARSASERCRRAPATVDDVRRSETADLNGDGFVTLDEIEAMQKSGLSDREIIDRLQRTGQVFQLDERQQDYLKDRGVSQRVIDGIQFLGRNAATAR